MKNLKLPLMGLGLMALFTACEGDNLTGLSEAEQKLTDYYLQAEQSSSRIFNLVDSALRDSSLMANDSTTIEDAVVTRDAAGVVTIDFGNGTYGDDGVLRSGSIAVQTSGNYFSQGGGLSVSLNNYKEADQAIAGDFSVLNKGGDSLNFQVNQLSFSESAFIFDGNKEMVWLSGFNTPADLSDDAYNISGSASGSYDNNSISSLIDANEALQYDRSCEYGITGGVLELSYVMDSASVSGSIDFLAADSCSNTMEITLNKEDIGVVKFAKTFNRF